MTSAAGPRSTPALAPATMRHYARSRAWCEWDDFETWHGRVSAALDEAGGAEVSPFHLLSLPGISAATLRACAARWMGPRLDISQALRREVALEFTHAAAHAPVPSGAARLKIGYLSSDFHQHATALLLIESLEASDASRFELHAYSHGSDDGSPMRQRLRAAFDGFHDVSTLDDATVARAIHAEGIDILVDLKGYTAGSRSHVMAFRAAPVQVSFLGYPGTLGTAWCDYLISDAFVTPPGTEAGYSEHLACLPHSYQPHGHAAALPPPPSRAAAGLPPEGLVLCCFNQAYKFTPAVFDIWCQLLNQVPGSVLWLLQDGRAEGNLRGEALRRGVAPHRLVFAPDLPQAEHLARLQLADLVLDTAPYNAHTTASDALWAGVPMVTCAGSTFASRVAGSLLHAVGLPELVTTDLAAYAELALQLAADPAALAALRQRLAGLREAAALFDVPAYTRHLEALFTAMWARHRAGLAPARLDLAARTSQS